MPIAKGTPKRGGRKKGTPNKINAQIRDAVFAALEHDEGATAFFIKQKEDNPVAYMGLVGKLLPKQVEGEISGDIEVTIKHRYV